MVLRVRVEGATVLPSCSARSFALAAWLVTLQRENVRAPVAGAL
jgi:hypothetical protein